MNGMRNVILVIVLLLASCTVNGQRRPHGELPLPQVPEELTSPTDRAAYIAEHFWDAMDWRDSTLLRDKAFMEQSFANFLSLFPILTRQDGETAVRTLMTKAGSVMEAYRTVVNIAEKYLYDPNSPMLNEELYSLFLEDITRSRVLDDADVARHAQVLKDVRKNSRGAVAADFEYIDRNGRRGALHSTDADTLLLVFYDPDCEHCTEIINVLRQDAILHKAIADGRLTVLAIYADGDRNLWDRTKNTLPEEWLVGIDISSIQQHGAYILRAMPTLYLLDSSKTVLAKDIMPAAISDILGMEKE